MIRNLLRWVEARMDDFTIKKKLGILYICCVLVPLIITDSVVFATVKSSDEERQKHEKANIANAVGYSLSSMANRAGETAKSIYTSKSIDDFLSREYNSSAEYVSSYQDFFKDTLLENTLGMNQLVFTLYTDNDTIVKGGKVDAVDHLKGTKVYEELSKRGENTGLFFVYDKNASGVADERRMVYLQKLDFYSGDMEKFLKIEFDYGSTIRILKKMNYDNQVFICEGNRIVLSNGRYSSTAKEFQPMDATQRKAYSQTIKLYGTELEIYVMDTDSVIWENLTHNLPLILLLIVVNAVLPICLVHMLNHSFTKRILELSEVFKSVDRDHLVPMFHEGGKDEIGSMIRNYNSMVRRTNELIQTVYKNKLKEQEMLVGRKNAELLALHSQINPHFLFNALESIRMHSILKQENETADMVEKLAIMQRQYVEWGNDSVTIRQETDFVKVYLALQKYRFGERLNYSLEIEPDCMEKHIPKLTIVTFVENACVHGIESKSAPGWIFVRIGSSGEELYIEVEDTGCGMDEDALMKLQNNMQNADIEMLKQKGRVGIVNACLRLKMVTENRVEFELDGEEGIGTTVAIRMPLKYTLEEKIC